MKKITCFIICVLILIPSHCYGFWVWSPKTGKWLNPTYRDLNTPKEQFEWAMDFFKDEDYSKTISQMRKLLKKFPKSSYAPEAEFYIALCYEKRKDPYKAFLTYQKVIDNYPLNERLDEIVEKQYLLGEKFLNRKNYSLAKKIFDQVLTNAPYSKVSDIVQYNGGLCDLRIGMYKEARDEFEYLIENYSFSPYVDDAAYQIGFCSFKISLAVKDYDVSLVDKAIEDLEYFMRRFKTSVYVAQAESLLNKLKHRKAEGMFNIAYFYEKQKKNVAAIMYYEQIVYSFNKTSWAKKANPRLKRLRAI
ncbi:MAG: outer membrane protein assembly factor BamD [Candidatus Omnitrophica bacterium]|nr:outer membrane protein assembly factor BamD [Candidatus Omnitrophota bacterium]